ncbi:acyl carrier protein [Pseudomonas fluorescens]|uniref:acyl carrier protein n=1 Tax=Pseudomonas fluorescens TaxID=294 RepID=UPI00278260C1|nr:acyl carrier protein [Pseudomonas fluorescens]MDP9781239.1 acyl carrier protein [Pseudomonas fluorescens]
MSRIAPFNPRSLSPDRDNSKTQHKETPDVPTTRETIIELISNAKVVADASSLRDNMKLIDQGIDSMDIFAIMLAIQDHYQIQIPDNDIEKLQTVNDLVNYIDAKQ